MNTKKIYIIGGVSRAGKTLLRNRLLNKYKIEGISTDILQGVIDKRHTEWEKKFEGEGKLEHYWPYILSLIYYQAKYSQNGFCIDSDLLTPKILKTIHPDIKFRAVFIGYSSISVDEKYNQIISNRKEHDWTNKLTEEKLKKHIAEAIKRSKELKIECSEEGFEYVDTSEDFIGQIDRVVELLLKG